MVIKNQKWQWGLHRHFENWRNRRMSLGAMKAVIWWQFKQLNNYTALMEFQGFHGPPTHWNLHLLSMSSVQNCLWSTACLCFLPCPALLPYGPQCWHAQTRTHTHSEFGLRNQHSKIQQKSSMPVSALFWRCWPGENVKSSIQNPILANGRASYLVPALLWFVFDRSVSNQTAIGQPIKKK